MRSKHPRTTESGTRFRIYPRYVIVILVLIALLGAIFSLALTKTTTKTNNTSGASSDAMQPLAATVKATTRINQNYPGFAWGANDAGQLGNPSAGSFSATPLEIALPNGVTPNNIALATDGTHALAIGSDGNLYAWGDDSSGELGNGTISKTPVTTPVTVTFPISGVTATAIAAGQNFSLAIGSNGDVYAWGDNTVSELGQGNNTSSSVPLTVTLPSGVTATAIAAGTGTAYALGSDHILYIWGYTYEGQLGNGLLPYEETQPQQLAFLANGVYPTAIAAGNYHVLAIGSDNKLYGWGYNGYGQVISGGSILPVEKPTVISLGYAVHPTAIAAGYQYSEAIGDDGNLYVWGGNTYGEIGNGTSSSSPTNSIISVTLAPNVHPVAIAAGYQHSLALGDDGNVYAWGDNSAGELANASASQLDAPTVISNVTAVKAIYAGSYESAITGNYSQSASLITTTLVSSANPSVYGQSVTFTTTVSPTNASGALTFTIDSTPVYTTTFDGSNDTATYITSTLNVGDHPVNVNFTQNNTNASSSLTQTVIAANTTTSLVASSTTPNINDNVVFTATVSPVAPSVVIPTGSVIFTDTTTNTSLGTAILDSNGLAVLNNASFAYNGGHNIQAVYVGNTDFNSSQNSLEITVNEPTTATTTATDTTITTPPTTATVTDTTPTITDTTPTITDTTPTVTDTTPTITDTTPTVTDTTPTTTVTSTTPSSTTPTVTNTTPTVATTTPTTTTTSPTTVVATTPIPNGNTYSYYLPFLANNASVAKLSGNQKLATGTSSYSTYVSIDNIGSNLANFVITYYDAQGNVIGSDNTGNNGIAPNNIYQATQIYANDQSGAAAITSNQPLDIVVSESGTVNGQTVASVYKGIDVSTEANTTLYAPIALNNSYGGYTTSFLLVNTGNNSTNLTIQYYSDSGQKAGSQTLTLAAHSQSNVSQDSGANLPSGFSGWAVVTSDGGQVVAGQVVETNPNFSFLETVNMPAMSGKTLFIPTIFQNAFGNFNTGMQLVNPNNTTANVTVTYYRKDGTKITAGTNHANFMMGANSDKSFYQDLADFPELNTSNGGFVGTAVVTSDQPLIAIVNQAGSLNNVQYNGAFGTVFGGASTVNVPAVVKNSYCYTTGLQVSNVSNVASTATISYYDKYGNKVYSTTLKSDSGGAIPAYGSVNPYLGIESNLPNNFDGIAVVTADNAAAQFIVIANNASSQFFYTFANNS